MPTSLTRRVRRIALVAVAVVASIAAIVGAFPWGAVVGLAVPALSRAAGRTVAIESARRLDWFSFAPTIEVRDVTVAQPDWAGPGPMARIAVARLTLPVLPLLAGHVRPRALAIDGLRLTLCRDREGRSSWDSGPGRGGRGSGPRFGRVTIADGRLTLVDLKRHVALAATLASDPARGLAIDGRGTDQGRPMTLAFHGGALGASAPGTPYPVRLAVASPLTRLDVAGRLDRPLDLSAMTVRVRASGRDLADLDDYVQAGLFPTANYALSGTLRRDGDHWRTDDLSGRIGRSDLAARLVVVTGGPTRIDGRIVARTLDFSDFSSAAARARGRAKAAAGPHVLPDTRIVLAGLAKIAATVRLDARRLLAEPSSPFRSLRTVATLADRRLTLASIRVGLTSGTLTGTATVDDRGRLPRLALDLRLAGGTIQGLFAKERAVQGPFEARVRLSGAGDTFRAAMADADGVVGFAMPSGTIRRDYATYLGGDVLQSAGAAIGGADDPVALRCLVGVFPTRNGVMTADPLILDDILSRGDGGGRVTLSDERLDLSMQGRSKRPGPLVLIAPLRIFGTFSTPRIDVQLPRAAGAGPMDTLGRIGALLKTVRSSAALPGRDVAPNADCGALVRKAVD